MQHSSSVRCDQQAPEVGTAGDLAGERAEFLLHPCRSAPGSKHELAAAATSSRSRCGISQMSLDASAIILLAARRQLNSATSGEGPCHPSPPTPPPAASAIATLDSRRRRLGLEMHELRVDPEV